MSDSPFSLIDAYLNELLVCEDEPLRAAVEASQAAGLPAIQVAANQGKLLHLLARLQRAERILEIGTLGGYSTIWLARALPPTGRLVTLELSPAHAQVARENLARAGVAGQVEVRVGPAVATLAQLAAEGAGPFDLVFIDADKPGYADYLEWSLRLSRPGTLIIADNVVRKGEIINADSPDPNVRGMRRFLELLARERRVSATALQTVGSKGHDGLALALVLGSADKQQGAD